MLPSVLPTETDHVPVLADEVLAALDPRPGQTIVDCTFGAGDSFAAALTFALARGDPLPEALRLAAWAGASVVTGKGPYSAQITL